MKKIFKICNFFCLFYFPKESLDLISAQIIAGGDKHSIFVCYYTTASASGDNSSGQLGTGTIYNTDSAVTVFGISGILACAAGWGHSLFLKYDGTVWACGENSHGELGNGTTVNTTMPVQVYGLSNVKAISAGKWHSLFLKNDGTVWACGENSFGQLGDGSSPQSQSIPVQVNGLIGITAISAGQYHSLFAKNDGTAWACGDNYLSGQLGDGTFTDRYIPVQVAGLNDVISVAGGEMHSLFLRSDSTVWVCGNNSYGQLGNPGASVATPIPGPMLHGVVAIAAGGYHSIYLKRDGSVWGSGKNDYGQLGTGSLTNYSYPSHLTHLSGITQIDAGYEHSLFLKSNGTIWASGKNVFGALADKSFTSRSYPVQTSYVCLTTETQQNKSETNVSVFPNPSSGQINIELADNVNGVSVNLINTLGVTVAGFTSLKSNAVKVDISEWPNGIYFLELTNGNQVMRTKLVKN